MVSIIVPVYNTEEYLHECLDSLLNQKYRDIEVILVDDGSTDSSGKICDEYALKDDRFKVIHQDNKGIAATRNVGLENVTGDFIMFVDSDDFVSSDFVSIMMNTMEREDNADIVCCKFYNYEQGEDSLYTAIPCNSRVDKNCFTGKEILIRRFDKQKLYFVLLWNKLFKKELFENIRFPEGQDCEDSWVSLDYYSRCNKVVCIDDMLYYYRKRKSSISRAKPLKWIQGELDWFAREIEFFRNSDNHKDIYYPARSYVSVIAKNKLSKSGGKLIVDKKLWSVAIDSLIKDDRINLKNKVKYVFYKMVGCE